MRPAIGFGGSTAALLVLVWSSATLAQGNCGDLVFTGELGQRFPNAKLACLDVVQKDGQSFAHYKARITNIRGSTVEAEFKLPDGSYTREIEFSPPSTQRVKIAGQSFRWSELSRGQELDVYMPPDRWEIAVPDDAPTLAAQTAPVHTVPVHEPTQSFAALPRTASFVPAFGMLGGLLTALGAFAGWLRRRSGPAMRR